MMLHLGYVSTDVKPLNYKAEGITKGIGGAIRFHLGKHYRIGTEGYVSTMSLMNNGSYMKTFWAGLLNDFYWQFGKFIPYVGLTVGGGALTDCFIFEGDNHDWEQETNVVINKNPFVAIDPIIGCDYCLSEAMHITVKFDCLFGGFPCQPFSIAGYRKGFSDTRGTLFYDIAEILQSRKPKAVFLENVKNLKTHDGGKTFEVIKATLEDLGYFVYDKVMNAMDYANVPQNRERIFIVCFDPEQVPNYKKFKFPEKQLLTKSVGTCIDDSIDNPKLMYTCAMSHYDELVRDITDESSIYQWRRQYVRKNQSHVCPTLTANMGTGGHNVPLIIRNGKIRKLSPKECLNFQGFPDKYQFPATIPMSAMYKQAGNSVVVPLIQAVCAEMVKVMEISSGGTNE